MGTVSQADAILVSIHTKRVKVNGNRKIPVARKTKITKTTQKQFLSKFIKVRCTEMFELEGDRHKTVKIDLPERLIDNKFSESVIPEGVDYIYNAIYNIANQSRPKETEIYTEEDLDITLVTLVAISVSGECKSEGMVSVEVAYLEQDLSAEEPEFFGIADSVGLVGQVV